MILALMLLAGFIGYAVGTVQPPVPSVRGSLNNNPIYQTEGPRIGPSSIIKSQSAQATGKIVKVDGNGVTIQGDDNKIIAFSLAPKFAVFNVTSTNASQSAIPQGNSNREDIKINQPALIYLELQGTQYYITTITYFPVKK